MKKMFLILTLLSCTVGLAVADSDYLGCITCGGDGNWIH